MILPDSKAFKKFWIHNEPYRYALTSREYPPVLLADEEWIFSNDLTALLKELMQFDQNKMKFGLLRCLVAGVFGRCRCCRGGLKG